MNGGQMLKSAAETREDFWPRQEEIDRDGRRLKDRFMSQMSHAAVWCSDGRLGKTRERNLLGLGTVDLIARPGAALLLAIPESRESILKEIATLHQLHHWPEIHLVDHTDCGAYRLQYQTEVDRSDQEYKLHFDNLWTAVSVIQERPELKQVKVRGFLYHLAEDWMEEVRLG